MINTSIEPVTFPLSIDSWNSFNDIGIYHIDYSKSNYKGKKFLIYAFNIGPSIIIENITTSEIRQLSQDYVTFQRLISINSINDIILDTIIKKSVSCYIPYIVMRKKWFQEIRLNTQKMKFL